MEDQSAITLAIAITQFIVSVISVIICSVVPLSVLSGNRRTFSNRRFLSAKYFTDSVVPLRGKSKLASYGMWAGIFTCKFVESYFFLVRGISGPIRELNTMKIEKCVGEVYLGSFLCEQQAKVILVLLLLTDFVLFFLDTYLWYIIWNTGFSVFRSFLVGVSIWTPWRNQFVRLPKRIMQRILSPQSLSSSTTSKRKHLVCQVWNSIVISMYRDHLLSVEHLQSLVYSKTVDSQGETIYTQPRFFVDKEDGYVPGSQDHRLDENSEATRRLSFFAQSLSTPMPKPVPVDEMPAFSVLIPHYSEKITLTLQEIIKKEDQHSNITLLEYLKHLYPLEWHNFVRDTKLLSEELNKEDDMSNKEKNLVNDLPFYSVGFKVATPEYILRTRIWASLRSQTLYRTISGFMNYPRAIKLIYSTECDEMEENIKIKLESF
ncbi:unnamed protein product [Ambrosiozyma monospora]|uniref:Unnamed protein product n=1 Tax=Ambrosiozyma monospora TaxID=43982 RepID=A0ACB5T6V4_AMBMO|nr:unnamed protein product [Ambrosiozyma monospora]